MGLFLQFVSEFSYLCQQNDTNMEKNTFEKLKNQQKLSLNELKSLLLNEDATFLEQLQQEAHKTTIQRFKKEIYVRALLETTNICTNNCYYCGIRGANNQVVRYKLTLSDIWDTAERAYNRGFRTLVMQGGESAAISDTEMTQAIAGIKQRFPDMAITLSLGERPKAVYKAWKEAGADRFLVRHESITPSHYQQLHPKDMSLENRIRCLRDLKDLGFQTGTGFMVGAPYQTLDHLAKDLYFMQELQPEMIGIGPFIPAPNTPFEHFPAGSVSLTLKLLSIFRLMHPHALIPSTTALSTLSPQARLKGILAGANVVMPNVSPENARKNYQLYTKKAQTTDALAQLEKDLQTIDYTINFSRGDYK